MQTITFSEEFFGYIKKLAAVSKAKQTRFFKQDGRCRITISTPTTLIHLSAGPKDFNFDGNEVNVSSLIEFIRFTELINYPTDGTITVSPEPTIRGHVYTFIKFENGKECARSMTADPTCFTKADHQVPKPRNEDPMHLLGSIAMTTEELKSCANKLKLVPGCQFFSVVVSKKDVKLYFKGRVGQQITTTIDRNSTRYLDPAAIDNAYSTDHTKYRKFQASYLSVLRGIECSYETEIRHIRGGTTDKMMLKSFATLVGQDPENPITLYCAAMECDGAEINAEELVQ